MQEQHAPGVKATLSFAGTSREDQNGIHRITIAGSCKMVAIVTCLLVEDELHEKLKGATEQEIFDFFELEVRNTRAYVTREKEKEQ